jgi:hypothetical protein
MEDRQWLTVGELIKYLEEEPRFAPCPVKVGNKRITGVEFHGNGDTIIGVWLKTEADNGR